MGKALAESALAALEEGEDLTEAPASWWKSKVLSIPQRRPTHEQNRAARWYLEKAPPDVDQRIRPAASTATTTPSTATHPTSRNGSAARR